MNFTKCSGNAIPETSHSMYFMTIYYSKESKKPAASNFVYPEYVTKNHFEAIEAFFMSVNSQLADASKTITKSDETSYVTMNAYFGFSLDSEDFDFRCTFSEGDLPSTLGIMSKAFDIMSIRKSILNST